MQEQSVIFFDIDGTLLNSKKELPISTKESIFKLKELGHVVAIATGRAPFMFEDLRKELDIHTYVSYNGQYVVLNGEVIYTNPLNINTLEKLTEEALQNDHPVVFMDHEDMKANVPDHPYIKESIETLKISHFPTHDPHYYKGRELYQSLLFCPVGEEKQYEQKYDDFDFVRWHPVSVDILPKGGSKAKGIERIAKELGVSPERIYAFGDGLNDVEMLSTVQNSVAMGNGEELVKEAAKFVTKSVEEDGIRHGLEMVGLL
ncbi:MULTISPECIES: Cof-type HAD-IIB family hydrolase [Neobacillus]|jgi:Cof subfamily protein (haloacid dehalogenase superfamily)|uniref:Cof-type HAD-IIB family hydrolase n=1 Tax=Neobacillus sedimentimangrovi TaxID=2699460 RepID=A0ABS8QJS3_9BACI|nr:Cof-type HAD-IIB family hydrolase [Neobacillus sedimentimangrovi]AIM15967.1 phosphatase [Bacillus sp. X1(2014)]MCD4839516.1 Cof-type HAD-IIB family hydrolase [Neobacillus sedimentimangrovi]